MTLREYLAHSGKTIQQASDETGYSTAAFYNWLNNQRQPNVETIKALYLWSGGALSLASLLNLNYQPAIAIPVSRRDPRAAQ